MMPASSRFSRVIGGAAALLLLGAGGPGAAAEKLAERTNRGLVELMIPGDAAAMAMAQDLAGVLDDGATRRLLPVIGRDAVEGLVDLKALRGVDIAIAQTDVLAAASSNAALAADDGVFTYITKLHDEELHLLARAEIGRIEDLAGKKVDFAGGAGITGPAVLGLLKLKVEPVFDDRARALQKLAAGEVAAMAYVAAKPTPLFDAPAGEGLHFLAVPMTPALAEAYVPARLTAADYPRLVAADAPVDTVAVGTALMVANSDARYRALPQPREFRRGALHPVPAPAGEAAPGEMAGGEPGRGAAGLEALPGGRCLAEAQRRRRRAAARPEGAARDLRQIPR